MSDIVDRLRNVSILEWCEPMCVEAADEIEKLRAGLMMAMQYENKCSETGKPCSDACGCRLEAEAWCEDFIVGDPGRI